MLLEALQKQKNEKKQERKNEMKKQRLTLKERKTGVPMRDMKGVLIDPLLFALIYEFTFFTEMEKIGHTDDEEEEEEISDQQERDYVP